MAKSPQPRTHQLIKISTQLSKESSEARQSLNIIHWFKSEQASLPHKARIQAVEGGRGIFIVAMTALVDCNLKDNQEKSQT